MSTNRLALALSLLLVAAPAIAQIAVPRPAVTSSTPAPAYPADLPPIEQVNKALRAHPLVAAARAGVRVEDAQRRRLEAGAAEFQVRLIGQQRRETRVPLDYNEWDVALERPIRSREKAELDARIGAQGVAQATLTLGDAMHEAGRELLRAWFAARREAAASQLSDTLQQLLARQRDVVSRRVRAGDAPPMELGLADSALAQSQAAASLAQGRARAARAELERLFPGLPEPQGRLESEPVALSQPLAFWQQEIIEHSHELGAARAETERTRLLASRAAADRRPDPSFGVRLASERGGSERIGGVYLSIPLPGAARSAVAEAVLAQSDAAAMRQAAVLRRIESEIGSAYERAMAAARAWQQTNAAALGMERNAALMERAYEVGEASLPELLAARRLAQEAALTRTSAAFDALELQRRLMLDAHLLWPLDDDDEGHAAH